MSEGSHVSKVTICVEILKWQWLSKGRYRAARAAKKAEECVQPSSWLKISAVLFVKICPFSQSRNSPTPPPTELLNKQETLNSFWWLHSKTPTFQLQFRIKFTILGFWNSNLGIFWHRNKKKKKYFSYPLFQIFALMYFLFSGETWFIYCSAFRSDPVTVPFPNERCV